MFRHSERLQKLIDLAETMEHTYYLNELKMLKIEIEISIINAESNQIKKLL